MMGLCVDTVTHLYQAYKYAAFYVSRALSVLRLRIKHLEDVMLNFDLLDLFQAYTTHKRLSITAQNASREFKRVGARGTKGSTCAERGSGRLLGSATFAPAGPAT